MPDSTSLTRGQKWMGCLFVLCAVCLGALGIAAVALAVMTPDLLP